LCTFRIDRIPRSQYNHSHIEHMFDCFKQSLQRQTLADAESTDVESANGTRRCIDRL
jgi:hypothetical protein